MLEFIKRWFTLSMLGAMMIGAVIGHLCGLIGYGYVETLICVLIGAMGAFIVRIGTINELKGKIKELREK